MKSTSVAIPAVLLLFMLQPVNLHASPEPELPLPFPEAVELYYEGEFEGALEAFRYRTQYDPGDTESLSELILLLQEAGKFDEAHTLLIKAQETGNTPADATMELYKTAALAGLPLPDRVGTQSPRELFWRGIGEFREGNVLQATETLHNLMRHAGSYPVARLLLGQIALINQKYDEAIIELTTALELEPNMTTAYLPLARARIALNQNEEAYRLLQRARRVLPSDETISTELRILIRDHPELEPDKARQQERRLSMPAPPAMTHLPDGRDTLPLIRVGLAEELEKLHLKPGGTFRLSSGEQAIFSGEAGQTLTFASSNSGIEVLTAEGKIITSGTELLELEYAAPEATTLLFDMAYGTGYYYAGSEDRYYRGKLQLLHQAGGITVVNILPLEEYLYSTVPSEIPAYWPTASLEAQAIAARSYTLANLKRFENRGFDLFASVRSASYRGAGNEAPSTTTAVDETRGIILQVAGQALNAVYSANSGGYTESSESVWGFNSPLKAVADPLGAPRVMPLSPTQLRDWIESRPASYSAVKGYHSPPAYRWRLLIPAEEIAARLKSSKQGVGRILSITSMGRGISGRIETLVVQGESGETVLSGDRIRAPLGGLRSNLFFSHPIMGKAGLPEAFLFYGAGWGHGVGMDQSGAAGMAANGWTPEEILAHYYPGVSLADIYSGTD